MCKGTGRLLSVLLGGQDPFLGLPDETSRCGWTGPKLTSSDRALAPWSDLASAKTQTRDDFVTLRKALFKWPPQEFSTIWKRSVRVRFLNVLCKSGSAQVVCIQSDPEAELDLYSSQTHPGIVGVVGVQSLTSNARCCGVTWRSTESINKQVLERKSSL